MFKMLFKFLTFTVMAGIATQAQYILVGPSRQVGFFKLALGWALGWVIAIIIMLLLLAFVALLLFIWMTVGIYILDGLLSPWGALAWTIVYALAIIGVCSAIFHRFFNVGVDYAKSGGDEEEVSRYTYNGRPIKDHSKR